MTERKPRRAAWETWVDRQIREARERGDFDDLPGAGQPLADIDQPHDDNWWVRKKLKREGATYLPPALALRKEADDLRANLADERSETALRRKVDDLNSRIRYTNRTTVTGPPTTMMPLDVEDLVRKWRELSTPS